MNKHRITTVLHFCEHFGGRKASLHGVARTFQWWLPLFDADRFRVLLCSRKGPDSAFEQMKQSGLEPLCLGYGKTDPRNLFALIRLLKRERVDIVHAHGYGACMWARLAGHLLGLPVVVHGRCNYRTVPLYQRPVEAILGPFTRYALAVSESTRQFTIRKRHIPASRVQVLYNGIPLDRLPEISDTFVRDERRRLDSEAPKTVIGVVGRIETHKGLTDALQAVAEIRRTHPDTLLWIVGDGAYAEDLKTFATQNGYDAFCRFLGFRRDAIQLMRCFDIQLFPSHEEGTPNTLFEAMAVGRPIAASTADGQGEILQDDQTALLFEPGDIAGMAGQVTRLMDDPDLRRKLEQAVLEKVKDFDGRHTVRFMEALYDRILRERA